MQLSARTPIYVTDLSARKHEVTRSSGAAKMPVASTRNNSLWEVYSLWYILVEKRLFSKVSLHLASVSNRITHLNAWYVSIATQCAALRMQYPYTTELCATIVSYHLHPA